MPRLSPAAFRSLWGFAALVLAALIFLQSSRPEGDALLPAVSPAVALAGHFAAYALLAFLVVTALQARPAPAVAAVIGAVTLYGAFIEAYQATVPGREPSLLDVAADLAGAAVGALAARWLLPLWSVVKQRAEE